MKIFYHNDNDGKCAAHMVYKWALTNGESITREDFYPVNYADKIPNADVVSKGEKVFIVDYSFNENTFNELSSIAFKACGNVIWLDHHKASQEIEEYVMNTKICDKVIIDMNRSGAKIAYDLLIKDTEIDTPAIKRIINLVDDYDRWILSDNDSLPFMHGTTLYKNGPLDNIWVNDPNEIITKGRLIKEYINKAATKTTKSNKFFIKINDKRCIVLNTPVKSSTEFGEYFDKYGLAIRFSFDGKIYNYSVYSTLPEIDCNAIARHFDPKGGGHKGAAGFTSEKLLLKDGFNFRIKMPKNE